MKEISVIVPVYNLEKYISQCIDSIINQKIDSMELILVNDGSTDKSLMILKQYQKKYPSIIKVIDKKNGGQGSARNEGIKIASGKYIGFVDGDDFLEPQTYKKALDIAKKQDLDLLFWNIRWIYEDGRIKNQNVFSSVLKEVTDKGYILSDPSPCNKLFNAKIIKDNKLFFPTDFIYEDFALIPSIINFCNKNKIEYSNKICYNYRQRINSTMLVQEYSPKFLDIIKSCQHLYQAFKGKRYYDEIEYLCIHQLLYLNTFKFLTYKKYDELTKCIQYVNDTFPKWKNNKYLKRRKILIRIHIYLVSKKRYKLATLSSKIRMILRGD